jgi:hypothetical protein
MGAGWAPEPVQTSWRREKYFAPVMNGTVHGRRSSSPITIPTELFLLLRYLHYCRVNNKCCYIKKICNYRTGSETVNLKRTQLHSQNLMLASRDGSQYQPADPRYRHVRNALLSFISIPDSGVRLPARITQSVLCRYLPGGWLPSITASGCCFVSEVFVTSK